MSLLPGQILPYDIPIGQADETGRVTVNHDWWLFWYNLGLQVLGTQGGLPATALLELESAESDAVDTDAIALRQAISNALIWAQDPPQQITSADLPDIFRALLLAQEALLPDPVPRAQPVQSIAVGASPFTYTVPFDATIAITGGTVSAIAIVRQGATVATGLTTGLIPLSRSDQVQVTYSVSPTMTFLPR